MVPASSDAKRSLTIPGLEWQNGWLHLQDRSCACGDHGGVWKQVETVGDSKRLGETVEAMEVYGNR